MIRKTLVLAALVLTSPAFAQNLSYNFVQVGYQEINGDGADGDAIGISGSFEIAENWFLTATYGNGEADFGADFDEVSVGVGYHTPLTPDMDFVATANYVTTEISSFFGSADADGFGMSIGVRRMATSNVEVGANLSYVDLGDGADGLALGANALYNFNANVAAGLSVSFDDDATAYGAVLRLYFGN